MFLKSLTLRGFKSFADTTRLEFEPGITVIVGPNGSGKSNIVDALTWALGSMSAKSLRGAQMADVIFAGGGGRKAMGRAQVEITIDNSSGALPIEYSEVTVGREMFATGENTYAVNDAECRLLDVQELLSDTGLGREAHTIVGQGQLDAILNAKPEDRRAFIEAAAGILKHRKRKERALRKLTQMDAHVERLLDLLRELRRQLRPLERQAEAARKHADLTAQLREVRRTRALREHAALTGRHASLAAEHAATGARLADLQGRLEQARAAARAIERTLADLGPQANAAAETHFALANLLERARGLVERIVERRAGLVDAVEEPVAGRDPAQLRQEARALRAALEEVGMRAAQARQALDAATAARQDAERARRAHEQAAAAEARRRAEARERQIRWEGEVAALRSALAQAAAEEGRLDSQLQGQRDRETELEADAAAVTAEIQRLDAQQPGLAAQLAAAEQHLDKRQAAFDEAVRHERDLETRRAGLQARADALFATSEQAGEGTLAVTRAAEEGRLHGVLGPLAELLQVTDGYAAAVSAALGPLGDALVVEGRRAAEAAIGFVRAGEHGRVLLLVSDERADPGPQESLVELGAEPLGDAVDGPVAVRAAVRRALAGVYVVGSFADAAFLAERRPGLVFVTRDGEVAGARGHAGGAAAHHTAVLSRAAAEAAAAEAEQVGADLLVAHRRVADTDRALTQAREEVDTAHAALAESDALITSAAERLGRLHKELARCREEIAATRARQQELAGQGDERRERLAALEARGPEPFQPDPRFADGEAGDVEAERLDDALTAAREEETQARVRLSSVEQEAAEVDRRAQACESEADAVERQLAERERRRQARLAAIARCDELERLARSAVARAEASRAAAAAERDRLEEARAEQQGRLGVARQDVERLESDLGGLRDEAHAGDLARQELEIALDGVRGRLADLGVDDPDAALAAADPDVLAGGAERDRELGEAEERLARKIGLLGTVNPLALEEHAAVAERHDFLVAQLDDLRASKRDLLKVVEAVDERIRDVFGAAFADVATQFERIFPRLFPGGSGRLVLTDPDDLLTTGVDVEAQPPGKRVKRLSLLSGGERSLTALAVLFAIFAARPSPFYVLDEVEAALDDVNLQRFLTLLSEFRGSSQLIVVTHQRRTMEIADVLYGVSMGRDGVSKVVSQKFAETVPS